MSRIDSTPKVVPCPCQWTRRGLVPPETLEELLGRLHELGMDLAFPDNPAEPIGLDPLPSCDEANRVPR